MPDAMPGTESVSGCERACATVPTEQAAEQQWDEAQIGPETDPAPLFPDGQVVVVRVIECRIERSFNGSWRARLTCEVIENSQSGEAEGREYGSRLFLYIKLPRRRGAKGPFGPARQRSKFYRMWTLVNGGTPPMRRDRMSLRVFRERVFQARTRVVKKDTHGHPLPEPLWYSVVEEFVP